MKKFMHWVYDNTILLLLGAFGTLFAVNIGHSMGYSWFENLHYWVHKYSLWTNTLGIGHAHEHHGHVEFWLTPHYIVNDILMMFFFAIAAKEVGQAVLTKDGALYGRKAAAPFVGTIGGMLFPALLFIAGMAAIGRYDVGIQGWACVAPTDIAFSAIVARFVFPRQLDGRPHPAYSFLMAVAILDDLICMVILAVNFPNPMVPVDITQLHWVMYGLLLCAFFRLFKVRNWVPYVIAGGGLGWWGFVQAGLHPSLALVLPVLFVPHDDEAWAITPLSPEEHDHGSRSPMDKMEHWLHIPVQWVLLFFGIANTAILFKGFPIEAAIMVGSLVLGKTFGISLLVLLGVKLNLYTIEMNKKALFLLAHIAGLGFTVAIFLSEQAFPPGELQTSMKMGAIASFGVFGTGILLGKTLLRQPKTQ